MNCKQNIFGFLNINKPPNCTSHDVIAMLRKSLGIKKIGHSGTLDPFASGVLVVGINDATRLFEYLPQDKVYIAEIRFGICTDTDDITGNVLYKSDIIPSLDDVQKKAASFVGKINQKPPIFSAIKIKGSRAYKLAREKEITLDKMPEKEVEIYSIEILSYDLESECPGTCLRLKIHCSGGTYIRSLARDLGYKLNTYATLSNLRRVNVGNMFIDEESIDPKLIDKTTLSKYLISPLKALSFPTINLSPNQIEDITVGRALQIDKKYLKSFNDKVQLLDNNNTLLAIGSLTDSCIIKPEKVFIKSGK